jgi:hypothetical protein
MMLMEWGTKTADRLGVECFVEGSQTGVPLYLRHGFEILESRLIKPVKAEVGKTKEWKDMEGTLVETLSVMRRPAKGAAN